MQAPGFRNLTHLSDGPVDLGIVFVEDDALNFREARGQVAGVKTAESTVASNRRA